MRINRLIQVLLILFSICTFLSADTLKLKNGRTYQGKALEITADYIKFQFKMDGGSGTFKFKLYRLDSLKTENGIQKFNQKKPVNKSSAKIKSSKKVYYKKKRRSEKNKSKKNGISRSEIEKLIIKKGTTKPAWFKTVPLEYPPTIQLVAKKTSGWNNQKNIGQFFWDIINPNKNRWKKGTKLLHHMLPLNKDNPEGLSTVIDLLCHCYHDLLEDYPRAIFWCRIGIKRKFGVRGKRLMLADSYFKMGNKSMAAGELKLAGEDYTEFGVVIKLWGDLGNYKIARILAEKKAKRGRPYAAYFALGNAYRQAGAYKQALICYQKVLSSSSKERRKKLLQSSAKENIAAIKAFELMNLKKIKDGIYQGSAMGYSGNISLEVHVKANRIENIKIISHREKQFYSAFDDSIRQIKQKQTLKGIDATTGATITAEAVKNASAKALLSGMN